MARMLAVYGKGGMGKSFFTTNLVSKLALLGNRTMQLGCDPKHDSCTGLFGGVSLPTLGDTWRKLREEGREKELRVHDVVFKTQIMQNQATVFGCEIGGPEVGRGCGGRGISFGFDILEDMGISQWALDYVVMDFLGDVVCGGFAMPLARSLAEEVIILCGNDRQSLYAANNIIRAAQYFASMGGKTRLLGLVINRDDGSGIAERFAQRVGLPVLLKIPLNPAVRDLADSFQLALLDQEFDALFETIALAIINRTIPLADEVAPLDYEHFMELFGAVRANHTLQPAYAEDLFARSGEVSLAEQSAKTKVAVKPHGCNGSSEPRAPKGAANGHTPLVEPVATTTAATDLSTELVTSRLLEELGFCVTEASRDPKKGLLLTVDGNVTICFGNEQDLDSKIAILVALWRSGERYHYVDLRRPASPLYR
jgi:chlorophyllide a reductase subunit X